LFISDLIPPTTVGRYRVSPLCRRLEDGRYAAGVSIRNGQGSATTDRVMRFSGSFGSPADAQRYAREQGLLWILRSGARASRGACRQQLSAASASTAFTS
jgi:hypothetical protein